jgi:hypothetical protein
VSARAAVTEPSSSRPSDNKSAVYGH